jgi:hypothetical protein
MSEMGRCRDCRHWAVHEYDDEHGNCRLAETDPPSLLWAEFEGAVVTLAVFGCVQFEGKT